MHARNTMAKPGPGILKKIARGESTGLDIELYSKKILHSK